MPAYWLEIDWRSKMDLKSGGNYRDSFGLSLKDGRFHQANLHYYKHLKEKALIRFEGEKLFNERTRGSFVAHFQSLNKKAPFWSFKLQYRPGELAVWSFSLTEHTGTRKENRMYFDLGLEISSF